ncbi:MAG: hypothetical protein IKW74_01555, partial [Thermoguttaceae bacterium]|nr:hypothetical protein [Thermoguttaceae bacterium]
MKRPDIFSDNEYQTLRLEELEKRELLSVTLSEPLFSELGSSWQNTELVSTETVRESGTVGEN